MKTEIQLEDCTRVYLPFPFPGFWNEGYCRLKVFSKQGRVVFLCSQLTDYHGTSITNAVEAIKEAAVKRLIQDEILKVKINLGPIEKLFKSAQEIISQKNAGAFEYINNNSIWIEHYPQESEISDVDSYSVVNFTDSGEPSWSYMTKEMLAQELDGIDLEVSFEELKNWKP